MSGNSSRYLGNFESLPRFPLLNFSPSISTACVSLFWLSVCFYILEINSFCATVAVRNSISPDFKESTVSIHLKFSGRLFQRWHWLCMYGWAFFRFKKIANKLHIWLHWINLIQRTIWFPINILLQLQLRLLTGEGRIHPWEQIFNLRCMTNYETFIITYVNYIEYKVSKEPPTNAYKC